MMDTHLKVINIRRCQSKQKQIRCSLSNYRSHNNMCWVTLITKGGYPRVVVIAPLRFTLE